MINILMILLLVSQCNSPFGNCPANYRVWYKPKPPAIQFDMVVYKYSGNYPVGFDGGVINRKHNCNRNILYPDSYTVILVPKESVDLIETTVGPDRVLRLSPHLDD